MEGARREFNSIQHPAAQSGRALSNKFNIHLPDGGNERAEILRFNGSFEMSDIPISPEAAAEVRDRREEIVAHLARFPSTQKFFAELGTDIQTTKAPHHPA